MQPTTSRDTLTRIGSQIPKCRQKSEETRISRNNRCLEKKVARNKYYKMVPCPQSQLGIAYGTMLSCTNQYNMQYAYGTIIMY